MKQLLPHFKTYLRKKYFLCVIISLLLLLKYAPLDAQVADYDSINKLWRNKVRLLTKSDSVSLHTNLQGVKYNPTFATATQIPFFGDTNQLLGDVVINHFKLENLPLMYDIFIDELILNSNLGLVKLRKEMVEQFTLYESKTLKHDFVHLSFVTNQSEAQNCYFEVIYKSENNKLYVKRTKELISKMRTNLIEFSYQPLDKYYLYHSGQYYYIKNLNNLLKVLNTPDNKLLSFIKSKKFSKRKLIEKQIKETISFFDSI